MHLYGGSGKHSKKKPEKGKKYEEYDYDAGYGEDYDYEDYDYEPAPRQSHSRNAGQTRKTEPKPRRSEPQRRSRRRDSEDIRSTNRTVYGGNGKGGTGLRAPEKETGNHYLPLDVKAARPHLKTPSIYEYQLRRKGQLK